MTRRKSYGTSRTGIELTEAAIAKMVEEAEAGLDVTKLRPRHGRPPIGSAAADSFPVRLDRPTSIRASPRLHRLHGAGAERARARMKGDVPSSVRRWPSTGGR